MRGAVTDLATWILAFSAVIPAGATLYFPVFWRWFEVWRRHPLLTYAMMFGTLLALGVAVYLLRGAVFRVAVAFPLPVRVAGWALVAAALGLGSVADRQLGLRVRSFAPFFEDGARIALVTTGAYAVVRHPIYAAGLWYQLGAFLVTGQLAVAAAGLVFGLGALWFTRQEERRLVERLDDPGAYARYRARVPALLPWPRGH
jgi:protein-S-isoprenylcysteine O-methyltransferase Ste14